ncbi:hypothetical protein RMCBS344292_01847 [Rhizopus microsporus]|nr:hypothetical protein RMCBS344292_01847 [Rhizopus microsporus]
MIKCTIDSMLDDEDTNNTLRDICNSIKEGDFMELRASAYNEFWTRRQLINNRNKQKADEALDQSRSSKRLKSKLKISERNALSEIIKNGAIDKYYNKLYKSLSCSEKNIISNGVNSILDLSDFSSDGQKKLFTKKEWSDLQQTFNSQTQMWKKLEIDVKQDLKLIEKMAVEDVKQAYIMCLQKQVEHAFTQKEKYFECYAHILKIIQYSASFLFHDNKTKQLTESDYVNRIWAPIFQSYFRDVPNVRLKWGDSVGEDSTSIKKDSSTTTSSTKNVIGDKVDLRIISTEGHDVLNVEFARCADDTKYGEDRRKILRESKNNGDYVYRAACVKKKLKKELKSLGIQIAANEGEITETRLVDEGLYISKKIGSLRLPSCTADLKVLRVLFERLDEAIRNAVRISNIHVMITKDIILNKNSMDRKRSCDVSPNRNDKSKERETNESLYSSWTRGSWFPPSSSKDVPFAGNLPRYFLSPLPVLSHKK